MEKIQITSSHRKYEEHRKLEILLTFIGKSFTVHGGNERHWFTFSSNHQHSRSESHEEMLLGAIASSYSTEVTAFLTLIRFLLLNTAESTVEYFYIEVVDTLSNSS